MPSGVTLHYVVDLLAIEDGVLDAEQKVTDYLLNLNIFFVFFFSGM